MKPSAILIGASLLLACWGCAPRAQDWQDRLETDVVRIDAATHGALGVHVQRLRDDATFDADGGRAWYLSSTIKVPVAIAVLQAVEAGELSLDQPVELLATDRVDGSGDMIGEKVGARFTIEDLLGRSLRNSDSIATDMLIRRLGVDALNRRVAGWGIDGFGPITTILQVRYDVYGMLHPGVAQLDNEQLLSVRRAAAGQPRRAAIARELGVAPDALALPTLAAAFERYYAGGKNSATLVAFAQLLERLVEGELLNPTHTALVLGHMRAITTGSRRLQAGLAPGTAFAQKTGTQFERACNVGVIDPEAAAKAVVVVACLEGFGDIARAEAALADLGRALQRSGVRDAAPGGR